MFTFEGMFILKIAEIPSSFSCVFSARRACLGKWSPILRSFEKCLCLPCLRICAQLLLVWSLAVFVVSPSTIICCVQEECRFHPFFLICLPRTFLECWQPFFVLGTRYFLVSLAWLCDLFLLFVWLVAPSLSLSCRCFLVEYFAFSSIAIGVFMGRWRMCVVVLFLCVKHFVCILARNFFLPGIIC